MNLAYKQDSEGRTMQKLTRILCRILFIFSFVLAAVAISGKLANVLGFGFLQGYPPSRLLSFAAVSLLFVIALQLREIKKALDTLDTKDTD